MGLFIEKLSTMGMILCMLMMIEFGIRVKMVMGEVYKVGDSAGWTTNTNNSYSSWASFKKFRVEDVLWFRYNATTDNVIRVSLSDFQSCNTSDPFKTFNSGNDSFTIKSPGHYYFTSSFSGHCEAGQKLDVRVPKSSPPEATPPPSIPTPSPVPSDSNVAPSSPAESMEQAPSPAENSAVASHDSMWLISTIGVVVGGLVVHGYV